MSTDTRLATAQAELRTLLHSLQTLEAKQRELTERRRELLAQKETVLRLFPDLNAYAEAAAPKQVNTRSTSSTPLLRTSSSTQRRRALVMDLMSDGVERRPKEIHNVLVGLLGQEHVGTPQATCSLLAKLELLKRTQGGYIARQNLTKAEQALREALLKHSTKPESSGS